MGLREARGCAGLLIMSLQVNALKKVPPLTGDVALGCDIPSPPPFYTGLWKRVLACCPDFRAEELFAPP